MVERGANGGGGGGESGGAEDAAGTWAFQYAVERGFTATEARKLIRRHGYERFERNVKLWQKRRDAGARINAGKLHEYITGDEDQAQRDNEAKRKAAQRAKTEKLSKAHEAPPAGAPMLDKARDLEEFHQQVRHELDQLPAAEFARVCELTIKSQTRTFDKKLLAKHRDEAKSHPAWLRALGAHFHLTDPSTAGGDSGVSPTSPRAHSESR